MAKKQIKPSISYSRQCGENLRAIIAEIKVRQHLTDAGMAKALNMPVATFKQRKQNPGRFRLEEIWLLYQALNVPDEQRKSVVVIGGQDEKV